MAPYVVFVASDVFGTKANLELEFPFPPTLAELTKQVEAAFTAEQLHIRPGHDIPYQVSKFHVVDEVTDDWVEVVTASQLRNYCQLYCFQPHSTRYTECQGHIPPARKPVGYAQSSPRFSAPGTGYSGVSPMVGSPGMGHHMGSQSPQHAMAMGGIPATSMGPMTSPTGAKVLPDGASHDDKVRMTFEETDTNKNRMIELDELTHVFRITNLDLTVSTTEDLFRKADVDRDNAISFNEWQRFCELYPTLLDSLYYRLKGHLDHLAQAGMIESAKAARGAMEDKERAARAALDASQSDADDAARRLADAERAANDANDMQRAAEDAVRDGMRDVDRARQARQERERELAAEKEKERQAQMRAQESARELEDAKRRQAAANAAAAAAEDAERRAQQALADAQREKERQRALAEQASQDAQAASDRHAQILGDIPRTVEEAHRRMQDADKDIAAADGRQRELVARAKEAAARAKEAARNRDDHNRHLQAIRDRQEPARRALADIQRMLEEHDRKVGDMEAALAADDEKRHTLFDQERGLVEQEIRLREQRATLEEKEGALRDAHSQFFQHAGRTSPGRSRSPAPAMAAMSPNSTSFHGTAASYVSPQKYH